MNKGINIGQFRGVNIVDYTQAFNAEFFRKYIEEGLTAVPAEHLQSMGNIKIFDECPTKAPAITLGGYDPPEATIEIYLDQNLSHILSRTAPKGRITKFLDSIFTRTFGKRFIIYTLLHELGHHVYHMTAIPETTNDNEASEKYAEEYANDIYNKKYPRQRKYYWFFNSLYRVLYWRRILKDNEIRKRFNKSVHTDAG